MVNPFWCYAKAPPGACVHSSKISSASLGGRRESRRAQHHLALWKADVVAILRSKEESQHQTREERSERCGHPYCSLSVQAAKQRVGREHPLILTKAIAPAPAAKLKRFKSPCFFHPKPLAAVSGQRRARNPPKGTSLSSCALACAQAGTAPLPSQRNMCCKGNENEGGKQFRSEAGGLKEMGLFIWQKA